MKLYVTIIMRPPHADQGRPVKTLLYGGDTDVLCDHHTLTLHRALLTVVQNHRPWPGWLSLKQHGEVDQLLSGDGARPSALRNHSSGPWLTDMQSDHKLDRDGHTDRQSDHKLDRDGHTDMQSDHKLDRDGHTDMQSDRKLDRDGQTDKTDQGGREA